MSCQMGYLKEVMEFNYSMFAYNLIKISKKIQFCALIEHKYAIYVLDLGDDNKLRPSKDIRLPQCLKQPIIHGE